MRRLIAIVVGLAPSAAWAVPGPDSVAVVANVNDDASVRLAERYRAARDIPREHVCLLDLPTQATIDVAVFRDALEAPLVACLGEAWDRIEAVVLVRGVPQRVNLQGGVASLAAVLGVSGSRTSTGADFVGQPAGVRVMCGNTPCYSATWRNPYRDGPFEPGFVATGQNVEWSLRLVTALDARTERDVERLIASATTAEALGGADGTFMLMDGADNARGVLDREYDAVMAALDARGFTDVSRPAFSRDETGHTLAAFFVGTARLDTTIEGNTFRPGAIVDNLTSLGAVPANFGAPEDEAQVSIARWVEQGVAGAHGAVAEPLNNCFPSRHLLVDYVDGYTLAEAYLKRMPFVYWRNLVLGDPMAAPYADRPTVELIGVADGDVIDGAVEIGVVGDAEGERFDLTLLVNGRVVEQSADGVILRCHAWAADGETQILAVAQRREGARSKGWTAVTVDVTRGREDCTMPAPDAGVVDAGTLDAGVVRDGGTVTAPDEVELDEGCACATHGRRRSPGLVVGLVLCALWCARRRRR
ncbi:MAG: TIGR03790 family protein [Deltaproteobacteria bacterium]|jgi:uncharacterized protein (TIGR03790 family)